MGADNCCCAARNPNDKVLASGDLQPIQPVRLGKTPLLNNLPDRKSYFDGKSRNSGL